MSSSGDINTKVNNNAEWSVINARDIQWNDGYLGSHGLERFHSRDRIKSYIEGVVLWMSGWDGYSTREGNARQS